MKNRSPVDPSVILFQGVGTWDAIAIAVAGMAPTLAMNLNPQEPAEHVGRVVPLVFALSAVVVLLVAWCFARLARDHPNAGSAYGFVAAILGPRAGLVAGWSLFGTYLCFTVVGLGAFGLFGANLLQRVDLWRDPSSFSLAVVAALVVGPLSIVPTRRAGLVLLVLEGVAVVAMLLMACAVLVLVHQGHGPQGDPPLRDLFIPTAGVGVASIAMGLSFGLLSFAGFEQAATLGEEVRKSRFTIPRVLIGTVLGAGVVFTVVTAAQTLGFGTDPAGVVELHQIHVAAGGSVGSLFWRLVRRPVRRTGHLFRPGRRIGIDRGMPHVFFLRSAGTSFRRARWRGFRRRAARPATPPSVVLLAAIIGYAAMRVVFQCVGLGCFLLGLHARSARPPGRLSARGGQRGRRAHRSVGAGNAMDAAHSRACGRGDRLHFLGQRLPAAARGLSGDSMDRPRLVLRAGGGNAGQSQAGRSHYVRFPGRELSNEARLSSRHEDASIAQQPSFRGAAQRRARNP